MAPTPEKITTLQTEIQTYDAKRDELERYYMDKFVLIKGDEVIGAYDTLDATASVAVQRFGRGPYLIRRVGEKPMTLPASVMTYGAQPAHATR